MKSMKFVVEVKERGRITIPYPVRKYLKIDEGTLVHVEIINISGENNFEEAKEVNV